MTSAPGFEWIADCFPERFDAARDGDFFPCAEAVARRLLSESERDHFSELMAACLLDPGTMHRLTSGRRIFADLTLVLLRAPSAADLRVELNIWLGGRATSIHDHSFAAVTACMAGECEEILFAPASPAEGTPVPKRVAPQLARHWKQGEYFRVFASTPDEVGTIHAVMHGAPVTVSAIVRTGQGDEARNRAWTRDTFELQEAYGGHLPEDLKLLALVCGSLGLRGPLGLPPLEKFPEFVERALCLVNPGPSALTQPAGAGNARPSAG